jgi:hypothetical protein
MSTKPPARDPDPSPLIRCNNAALEIEHSPVECDTTFVNDADGACIEVVIPDSETCPPEVLSIAGRYSLSQGLGQPQGDAYVARFV